MIIAVSSESVAESIRSPACFEPAHLGREQHRLDHARRGVAAVLASAAEPAVAVDDRERDDARATVGELARRAAGRRRSGSFRGPARPGRSRLRAEAASSAAARPRGGARLGPELGKRRVGAGDDADRNQRRKHAQGCRDGGSHASNDATFREE